MQRARGPPSPKQSGSCAEGPGALSSEGFKGEDPEPLWEVGDWEPPHPATTRGPWWTGEAESGLCLTALETLNPNHILNSLSPVKEILFPGFPASPPEEACSCRRGLSPCLSLRSVPRGLVPEDQLACQVPEHPAGFAESSGLVVRLSGRCWELHSPGFSGAQGPLNLCDAPTLRRPTGGSACTSACPVTGKVHSGASARPFLPPLVLPYPLHFPKATFLLCSLLQACCPGSHRLGCPG